MTRAMTIFSVGGLLVGCGPGAVAEAVRPEAPTAAEALGEGECRDVARGAEPLVADWTPDLRGDLEVAMRGGVAVVAYDCNGLRVLTECKLAGNYGFLGMTRKEQVVRLESADEVRANLPLSGAKLGGELTRGATLDIAMVMVGKRRTTWQEPTRADLEGSCDGATHYVKAATVGAFALQQGSSAQVRAAAEVFGAGAETGSSAKKRVENRDGDPRDCANAKPDSPEPPAQCGAPLRLVLMPFAPAPSAEEPKPPPAAEIAPACPAGLVLTDGKCTAASSAPFQCDPADRSACEAQCAKGHAGSCATLGELLLQAREAGAAEAPLKQACEGGDARGCALLAAVLSMKGADDLAVAAAEKACLAGEATGCTVQGRHLLAGRGVTADAARGFTLLEQGCEGGDDQGCASAAKALAEGTAGAPDRARALALHQRACNGTVPASCLAVGEAFDTGQGAGKNPVLAEMAYRRACFRGDATACFHLGRLGVAARGAAGVDAAKPWLLRACLGRASLGCAAMKVVIGENRAFVPEVAEKTALQKSCNAGVARDCGLLGLVHLAEGQAPMAKPVLSRACTQGDRFACFLADKAR